MGLSSPQAPRIGRGQPVKPQPSRPPPPPQRPLRDAVLRPASEGCRNKGPHLGWSDTCSEAESPKSRRWQGRALSEALQENPFCASFSVSEFHLLSSVFLGFVASRLQSSPLSSLGVCLSVCLCLLSSFYKDASHTNRAHPIYTCDLILIISTKAIFPNSHITGTRGVRTSVCLSSGTKFNP